MICPCRHNLQRNCTYLLGNCAHFVVTVLKFLQISFLFFWALWYYTKSTKSTGRKISWQRNSYTFVQLYPVYTNGHLQLHWGCRGLLVGVIPLMCSCCTLPRRVGRHHWCSCIHQCLTCWLQETHFGTSPQEAC